MKLFQNLMFIAFTFLLIPACTIETIDDDMTGSTNAFVSDIDGGFYNYQDIVVTGSSFSETCGNHGMKLIQNGTELDLDITSCSATEVIGFIPIDIEPGAYELQLTLNGAVYTPSSSNIENQLSLDIKRRPVILSLSSTTFSQGDVITATGMFFDNPTTQSVYDPATWITATGYSHQTSQTVVNADGTEAQITIANSVDDGDFMLKIVSREFGNEIAVTVE